MYKVRGSLPTSPRALVLNASILPAGELSVSQYQAESLKRTAYPSERPYGRMTLKGDLVSASH
jgi:hypothetical protein